jgi:sodium transport system ATP-binding protein
MIEAHALRKRFGDVLAVEEVTFRASDGLVTGLLGPNGAGKSTALRMIGGLITPDEGHARIDGIDPRVDPRAARARIGILPDARGLYARLTARENVRYFGELCGLGGRELERRIDELFELLELAPLAERRVDGFSQGERMKVAIARAVVHSPQNVVLDEPTNGLDVMSIRSLRTFVRELGARGHAVLFSSHVMSEVVTLCDRVVVIAAGRVVASGTPEDVRQRAGCDSLEDAFVSLVTVGARGDAREVEP